MATTQKIRENQVVLSADELNRSTDGRWPAALIEDYLNIKANEITLAEAVDETGDKKLENFETDLQATTVLYVSSGAPKYATSSLDFKWINATKTLLINGSVFPQTYKTILSDKSVIYVDGTEFAEDVNFQWDKATPALNINGEVFPQAYKTVIPNDRVTFVSGGYIIGDANLLWDGVTLTITGNLVVTGIVTNPPATKRIVFADSPYTVLATDEIIFADTDGGAIIANLPAGSSGKRYKLTNTGTSGNSLLPTPSGAEKLFGDTSPFPMYDAEIIDINFGVTEGWW